MALPTTGYDSWVIPAPGADLSDPSVLSVDANRSADWKTACDSADGTKRRWAKDDGTELAGDPIDFDNSTFDGYARIGWSGTLSALASAANRTVREYPADSGNTSNAASATYGSDNAYDADWLWYAPDGGTDNRIGTNGTANGGVTAGGATGTIGDATDYDGTDDYIDRSITISPPFTLMGQANPDTSSSNDTVIAVGDFDAGNEYARLFRFGTSGNRWGMQTARTGSVGAIVSSASYTATTGAWDSLSGVVESTSNQILYVNGNTVGNNTPSAVTWANVDTLQTGANVRLASTPDEFWDGQIEQSQVHSTDRSAEWIAFEYDATSDNATFQGTVTWNAPAAGGTDSGAVLRRRYMMMGAA